MIPTGSIVLYRDPTLLCLALSLSSLLSHIFENNAPIYLRPFLCHTLTPVLEQTFHDPFPMFIVKYEFKPQTLTHSHFIVHFPVIFIVESVNNRVGSGRHPYSGPHAIKSHSSTNTSPCKMAFSRSAGCHNDIHSIYQCQHQSHSGICSPSPKAPTLYPLSLISIIIPLKPVKIWNIYSLPPPEYKLLY